MHGKRLERKLLHQNMYPIGPVYGIFTYMNWCFFNGKCIGKYILVMDGTGYGRYIYIYIYVYTM